MLVCSSCDERRTYEYEVVAQWYRCFVRSQNFVRRLNSNLRLFAFQTDFGAHPLLIIRRTKDYFSWFQRSVARVVTIWSCHLESLQRTSRYVLLTSFPSLHFVRPQRFTLFGRNRNGVQINAPVHFYSEIDLYWGRSYKADSIRNKLTSGNGIRFQAVFQLVIFRESPFSINFGNHWEVFLKFCSRKIK